MIRDAFFVLRMLAVTVLVVLALQVKVGENTVEDNVQYWIENSFLVDKMQGGIDGGFALAKKGLQKATSGFSYMIGKINNKKTEVKKERSAGFKIKRFNSKDDDDESLVDEITPKALMPPTLTPKATSATPSF